jgi:hypothetical protein
VSSIPAVAFSLQYDGAGLGGAPARPVERAQLLLVPMADNPTKPANSVGSGVVAVVVQELAWVWEAVTARCSVWRSRKAVFVGGSSGDGSSSSSRSSGGSGSGGEEDGVEMTREDCRLLGEGFPRDFAWPLHFALRWTSMTAEGKVESQSCAKKRRVVVCFLSNAHLSC